MYAAADEIRKKLVGRSRCEVRADVLKQQRHVDEREIDNILENERKMLADLFDMYQVVL